MLPLPLKNGDLGAVGGVGIAGGEVAAIAGSCRPPPENCQDEPVGANWYVPASNAGVSKLPSLMALAAETAT